MKKKNDVIEVKESNEVKDLDDISINSNDANVPPRTGFFSRRDKSKGIHIQKNQLSSGAKKSMATRIISACANSDTIPFPFRCYASALYDNITTIISTTTTANTRSIIRCSCFK